MQTHRRSQASANSTPAFRGQPYPSNEQFPHHPNAYPRKISYPQSSYPSNAIANTALNTQLYPHNDHRSSMPPNIRSQNPFPASANVEMNARSPYTSTMTHRAGQANAMPRPRPSSSMSAYESQAARWKQGFQKSGIDTKYTIQSRRSDMEAPLIMELCSPMGSSSFPPRDVLQKLSKLLPTLDHELFCDLLNDKLENRLWQVQAKAVSVVDALIKNEEGDYYRRFYARRLHIFTELMASCKKEILRARTEKIYNALQQIAETLDSEYDFEQNEYMDQEYYEQDNSADHENLLLDCSETEENPSQDTLHKQNLETEHSRFSFLNPGSSNTLSHTFVPSDLTESSKQGKISAFDAIAHQSIPPIDRHADMCGEQDVSLIPSLPESGSDSRNVNIEEEAAECDPFAAFDEIVADHKEQDSYSKSSEPTVPAETANDATVEIPQLNDTYREVILEIDVPPGPMGIVLDDTIENMAVIARFIPISSGMKGILELHPAICPGCQLISINNHQVEHTSLKEVGEILYALASTYKVLRFKKLMVDGRAVNPSTSLTPYKPPPLPQQPTNEEPSEHLHTLLVCSNELDQMENTYQDYRSQFEQAIEPAHGELHSQIAQLHGNIEKLQTERVDSVIIGADPPHDADKVKVLRSELVKRCDSLTAQLQDLADKVEAQGSFSKSGDVKSDLGDLTDSLHFGLTLKVPLGNDAEASAFTFLRANNSATDAASTMESHSSSTAFSFLNQNCSYSSTDTTVKQESEQSVSAFSFIGN